MISLSEVIKIWRWHAKGFLLEAELKTSPGILIILFGQIIQPSLMQMQVFFQMLIKMENIPSLKQKFSTIYHQDKVSKPRSTNTFQKSPETVVIALPWFAAVLSVLFASIVFCY